MIKNTSKDILIKMLERNSVDISDLNLSEKEESVLAAIAHSLQGVKRKNNEDYIMHILQVRSFTNEILFPDGNITSYIPGVTALLHDEVEDSRIIFESLPDFLLGLGFDHFEAGEISIGVYLLSHGSDAIRSNRVIEAAAKLMKSPINIAIKVADIKSNTLDTSCLDPEFRQRYIQEKITQLFILLLAIRGIKDPTEQHKSIKKELTTTLNYILTTQYWIRWTLNDEKIYHFIDDEIYPFFSQA